jgi:hypothetical protein
MKDKGWRWKCLRRAAVEGSSFAGNWRWMLASLAIGAGFGMVAGLQRLGMEPARVSLDVMATIVRAALTFFVIAWLVAIAVRFSRLLRSAR